MKSSLASRLLLAGSALALALVPAARAQFGATTAFTLTGSNVSASTGATTSTLGGVTFSNLGLVGVGRIDATAVDAFGETLGSVSGLQVTNWTINGGGNYSGSFNFTPDRGYNGATFSNYAARIQTVDFNFTPYTGTATSGVAQNQFNLTYNGAASAKFTYDSGGGTFVTTTGLVPDSNTTLAGKIVPFVTVSNGLGTGTTTGTTSAINRVSLDTEGLVLKGDGSGFISDEYGANIYHFNSAKQIDAVITPPAAVIPHTAGNVLNFSSEVSNVDGRRGNQGMEGVALSPDGTKLFGLMQSATIQDSGSGNQGRLNTRLFVYDVNAAGTSTTLSSEYVIKLPVLNDTGSTTLSANKTAAQSEIVALDNTHLLVLSRDGIGNGTATTSGPVFKSVLLVDLATGSNILGSFDGTAGDITPSGTTLAGGITPMTYVEAVNLLNTAQLSKFGLHLSGGFGADTNSLSEKWEGLSLVPTETPGEYFLFVANDNDFISGSTVMRGLDGNLNAPINVLTANGLSAQNDTMFLAYRVSLGGVGQISAISAIPEPSTWAALVGCAALLVAVARRRFLVT